VRLILQFNYNAFKIEFLMNEDEKKETFDMVNTFVKVSAISQT